MKFILSLLVAEIIVVKGASNFKLRKWYKKSTCQIRPVLLLLTIFVYKLANLPVKIYLQVWNTQMKKSSFKNGNC